MQIRDKTPTFNTPFFPSSGSKHSGLVFLAILALISGVVLNSTLASSTQIKAVFLAISFALALFLVVLNPADGYMVWTFILSFLVTQTGFQLDVGPVRTSALEIMILVLLFILVVKADKVKLRTIHFPGQNYFNAFAIIAGIMLAVSMFEGTAFTRALTPLKGFLLYPLMAYLMLVGVQTKNQLTLMLLIMAVIFGAQAIIGTENFAVLNQDADQLIQISEAFAPTNIYGITLVSFSLFLFGYSLYMTRPFLKLGGFIAAILLLIGAVVSGARTVLISAFFGGIALLLVERRQWGGPLILLGFLTLGTLYFLPDILAERLFQLTDSSTFLRSFYLASGLRAWGARFFTGWGWGKAFWLPLGFRDIPIIEIPSYMFRNIQLVPSSSYPWYHNDYLNLAVQVGVIGLGTYLLFWGQVLKSAIAWLQQEAKNQKSSEMYPYVIGSFMGLVGLLVSASFEHVLWRPDSAGVVGWMFGVLLASIRLGMQSHDLRADEA